MLLNYFKVAITPIPPNRDLGSYCLFHEHLRVPFLESIFLNWTSLCYYLTTRVDPAQYSWLKSSFSAQSTLEITQVTRVSIAMYSDLRLQKRVHASISVNARHLRVAFSTPGSPEGKGGRQRPLAKVIARIFSGASGTKDGAESCYLPLEVTTSALSGGPPFPDVLGPLDTYLVTWL